MRSVLIYGFNHFGAVQNNPSMLLIESLSKMLKAPNMLFKVFDVSYKTVENELKNTFEEFDIQTAIGFGLAEGEHAVRLEQFAHNAIGRTQPDVQGFTPQADMIVKDGVPSYRSAFDLVALTESLLSAGIPARISYDAGGYLCNYAYYLSAYLLTSAKKNCETVFIHLPLHPKEAARLGSKSPSMSIDMMADAAKMVIERVANST